MSLVVPDPRSGMNAFALPQWWASLEDERVVRDDEDHPDQTVIDAVIAGVEGDRTLLVVPAITDLLAEPTLDALAEWVGEVRALHVSADAPVHLAVCLDVVTSLDQVLTLAAGRRWPPFDVAAAAARSETDPVPALSFPRGQEVVRAYADAVVAQVEVLLPPAWQTAADGAGDAVAAVTRALDADAEIGAADARELRDACRAALADLEAEDVTISGPRDALLWPVPAQAGRIPLDVVTDAALEVMLSLVERRVDLAPDRPRVVPAGELPARALLARLGGRR